MRLVAFTLILSLCTLSFAVNTTSDSLLLLLRNDLNVTLTLEDTLNSRTWDINRKSSTLINLLAPADDTEYGAQSTITLPISLSVYYTKGKSLVAIPDCLPTNIIQNSIVQVFNGNNGIECFFSEYQVNQD